VLKKGWVVLGFNPLSIFYFVEIARKRNQLFLEGGGRRRGGEWSG